MKAISVRQPWAYCIMHAGKDVENRMIRTFHRGPILIHASKTLDEDGYLELLERGIDLPPEHELPRGCLLGIVEITDCRSQDLSEWFEGPWGYVLANPMPFHEPVPFRAMPGIFTVPDGGTYSKP